MCGYLLTTRPRPRIVQKVRSSQLDAHFGGPPTPRKCVAQIRPGNWSVIRRCTPCSTVLTLELAVAEQWNRARPVKRSSERVAVTVPARITWKDASGAVRFASVTTRNISEAGVFVECETGAAIPLYRLVHLQVERSFGGSVQLPAMLREGRVLSAVWRVAPCRRSTGTPSGYALRFLVDPQAGAVQVASTTVEALAV
ncbi:MAG TPA: PilZ domain-containing protein [Vicinamibacterales bacterium]|nr:PilZ domain-containing protein [Vicinamibacterales bacterium]